MGHTARLGAAALALATLIGLPLGVLTGARPRWAGGFVHTASIGVLSLPPLVSALLLVFLGASTDGSRSAAAICSCRRWRWRSRSRPRSSNCSRSRWPPRRRTAHIAAPARGGFRMAPRVAPRPAGCVAAGARRLRIIIGTLFSGSFVVEFVTSVSGLGRLMYEALVSRDTYLVAGCAATGAVFLASGTLIADLLLVSIDPRLRQEAS